MKTENEKTELFLKEAFCIDGDCRLKKQLTLDGKIALMFELNDSKRGRFYITMSK